MNIKEKMGRLFRSANKQKDKTNYINYYSPKENRGIKVSTSEQALRLDVVYRCLDILSGTIASLPIYLRKKEGEIYKIYEDSSLNDIFSGQANEKQTFYVLMQNAILNYYLNGNTYIYPKRNNKGEVVEMFLLKSECVTYDILKNTYTVSDYYNSIHEVLEPWEIIHLKNKCLDGGYIGVSTISFASEILSISANADFQTLDGLKRGNKMKGFISGGNPVTGLGTLQDEVQDKVAERLEYEIDSDKSIMRLPGAIQFTPISINPVDAQLLETRKFSPYGICRFFGVHPDMVFVEQSSNYKASENSQVTFLNQTLRPLLAQIEAEFKAKLILGSPSIKRRYRIEYDLFELYATDVKTKAEQTKLSIEAGVLTPNEARIRDNRPPIEGGDVMFISCNVAPINRPKIKGEKESGIKKNSEKAINIEEQEKDT